MNKLDLSLLILEAQNKVRKVVMDFQRQFLMLDEIEKMENEPEEVDYVEGPATIHQEADLP